MKSTIALFVADPKCSVQSCNGIMRALENDYNFRIFSKNEIEDGYFDNIDIIAVPGGFGDSSSFDIVFKNNRERVKQFVAKGGKYLGICMGAYWAGHHYFNLVDWEITQYITRPNTDTKRPHAKAMDVLWKNNKEKMFFYDGCAIAGDCDIISTYPNGDAMAVIKDNIGLIGCHPESEKFWYDSYSWMKPHWHGGTHHKLLLDFVKELENK